MLNPAALIPAYTCRNDASSPYASLCDIMFTPVWWSLLQSFSSHRQLLSMSMATKDAVIITTEHRESSKNTANIPAGCDGCC